MYPYFVSLNCVFTSSEEPGQSLWKMMHMLQHMESRLLEK